jgi:hypothetical protein
LRFHEAGVELLEVTAVRGVSKGRDRLTLVDAVLVLPDGSRTITAGVAQWTPGETSFVLPGAFEIAHGGEMMRGSSARVDLRLEIQ